MGQVLYGADYPANGCSSSSGFSSSSCGQHTVNADVFSRLGPEVSGAQFNRWTTRDHRTYFPAAHVTPELPPGLYSILESQGGVYFENLGLRQESVLRFPDTVVDELLAEIAKFWERKALFDQYGLSHRRGILLHGPQGSGKTCALRLLSLDVIQRGGVVINFDGSGLFRTGWHLFRQIQPTTPAIVLMEDLDAILERDSASSVLNILDGAEEIQQCLFLATTNYPEKLEPRVANRPSRFDRRIRIGHPSAETRQRYLEHLLKGAGPMLPDGVDLDQWVADSADFSFAHLKELFLNVFILDNDYAEVLARLRDMKTIPTSDEDLKDGPMGFTPRTKPTAVNRANFKK